MLGISDGIWCETDTLLAEALEIHARSKCGGGCGHYTDEAHDPENDGAFDVEQVLCHACAARDRWQREQSEGKSRPEPGALTWVRKLARQAPRRRRR